MNRQHAVLRTVLWIEDGARVDIPHLAAPVYMSGRYDLALAENATEGQARACASEYDVVIVDIRLPPGKDPTWIDEYKKLSRERGANGLGLKLINCLLSPAGPNWLQRDRIGILTVESWDALRTDLKRLDILEYQFQQKTADVPETILLDLIDRIVRQQHRP